MIIDIVERKDPNTSILWEANTSVIKIFLLFAYRALNCNFGVKKYNFTSSHRAIKGMRIPWQKFIHCMSKLIQLQLFSTKLWYLWGTWRTLDWFWSTHLPHPWLWDSVSGCAFPPFSPCSAPSYFLHIIQCTLVFYLPDSLVCVYSFVI